MTALQIIQLIAALEPPALQLIASIFAAIAAAPPAHQQAVATALSTVMSNPAAGK